jgi:hypothetical protein
VALSLYDDNLIDFGKSNRSPTVYNFKVNSKNKNQALNVKSNRVTLKLTTRHLRLGPIKKSFNPLWSHEIDWADRSRPLEAHS